MLALATLAFSSPAGAESQYSTLYVFGKEYRLDRGRVPELVFEQNPDLSFDIPVSPPYFEGRYTNGPTYVERLPDLLGFPPAPEQNFAVAGAETGDENGFDGMLPDLSGGTIELPGIAEQIDAFLENGGVDPLRCGCRPAWRGRRLCPLPRGEPGPVVRRDRRESGRDHLQHRRGHPSLGRRRRTHLRRSERGLHEVRTPARSRPSVNCTSRRSTRKWGASRRSSASKSWSPTSPRESSFLSAPRRLSA